MSDTLIPETFSADDPKVKNLINRGRSKGYVTYEEVLKLFPNVEEEIDYLDSLYMVLLEEGIELMEDVQVDEALDKDMAELEKELRETTLEATLDRSITGDPVKMYLREIGRENLLTAKEEVELAKMVEASDYELAIKTLAEQGITEPDLDQIGELMIEEYTKKARKKVEEAKTEYERIVAEKLTFKMRKAREDLLMQI